MLKYITKITTDIFPSVLATIIGAYIVNHYIVARPAADPAAAVAASSADPKAQHNAGSAQASAEFSGIPGPGVTAKGISEKAMMETPAEVKPAETKPTEAKAETKSAETKSAEAKPTETRPTETGSITAEPRRHRDAAELARAAIERLRGGDGASHARESARVPDLPPVQEASPTVAAGPIKPLPPPITVSTSAETPPSQPINQPYTASIRDDGQERPTPPADIPLPQPTRQLDLRADAGVPVPQDHAKTVADDMLAAAKSMFHAVLPQ